MAPISTNRGSVTWMCPQLLISMRTLVRSTIQLLAVLELKLIGSYLSDLERGLSA